MNNYISICIFGKIGYESLCYVFMHARGGAGVRVRFGVRSGVGGEWRSRRRTRRVFWRFSFVRLSRLCRFCEVIGCLCTCLHLLPAYLGLWTSLGFPSLTDFLLVRH